MIEEFKAIITKQEASVLPDEGDGSQFPDGSGPWAMCWAWVHDLEKRLGSERVKKFGFSEEDNPTSEIAELSGGHDFAIVDGRYLVDGWAQHVEQVHATGVFDLEDDAELADISRLYGDPRLWEDAHFEGEWERAAFARPDPKDQDDFRNKLADRIEAAVIIAPGI
jgi:hypothetical protein